MAERYEVGAVFMRVMPSFEGASQEMTKQLNQAVDDTNIDRGLRSKVQGAFAGIKIPDMSGSLFKGAGKAVSVLQGTLNSAVSTAGGLFGSALSVGAKTAGAALATSIGAIGTQVIGGGFSRALGINQATAGLKAMGYEGQKFTAIMDAAGKSVDGTAYSMDQSVLAARNFIASGVPEEKLQGYLENVGKLADMGTRSYGDISTIMQKMAASGRVMGDDMLQLADAGIPIYTALSKSIGVSVDEVRKLGSDGAISFEMMNDAIGEIDWDSALFAATDVSSAWRNVRSQLSKTGEKLWQPIIEKLPSILGDIRAFIAIFGKTFDFNPIQVKLSAQMEKISSVFNRFKGADGVLDPGKVTEYTDTVIGDFKNLAQKLEAYKGPIIGVFAGMAGSLLSSLPGVGPIFAGLTPIVGLFSGVLYQAFQSSTDLQESLGGLVKGFTATKDRLFDAAKNVDGRDLFKEIGDGLAKGLNAVTDFIGTVIDAVGERMPEIQKAVGTMMDGITRAFEGAAGNGLNADAIASIFTQIVDIFTTYVPIAINTILNVLQLAGQVIGSDAFKGFIGWLGDVFTVISQNEGLILAGIAAGLAIFVGAKLIPLLSAIGVVAALIGRIIPGLKTVATGIGKAAQIAPAVKAGSVGLKASLAGFGGILLTMGKVAVVIGLIVAAMAGIGYLMEKTGFQDYVNVFVTELFGTVNLIAEGIANVVGTLLPALEGVLNLIVNVIVGLIQGVVGAIMVQVLLFVAAMAIIVNYVSDAATQLVNAFSGLLDSASGFLMTLTVFMANLAVNGVAAGAGAHAAAGGIAALMAAVAGGSLAASGANLFEGLVGGLTGKGGEGALAELTTLVSGLATIAAIADRLPEVFATSLQLGMSFGLQLPQMIATGLLMGAPLVAMALTSAIQQALAAQQANLDANPLIVRLRVDDTPLRSIGAADSGGSGSTTTTNTTTNISTTDASIARNLLRQGRGR